MSSGISLRPVSRVFDPGQSGSDGAHPPRDFRSRLRISAAFDCGAAGVAAEHALRSVFDRAAVVADARPLLRPRTAILRVGDAVVVLVAALVDREESEGVEVEFVAETEGVLPLEIPQRLPGRRVDDPRSVGAALQMPEALERVLPAAPSRPELWHRGAGRTTR